MNLDPPKAFDPTEALSLFAEPTSERYGLSDRVLFYAQHLPSHRELCRVIASSLIRPHPEAYGAGRLRHHASRCWIEFIIKAHVFWIDVSATRVRLWTALADDADGVRNRYLVHDGDASDAKAWEGLLDGDRQSRGVRGRHAPRRHA